MKKDFEASERGDVVTVGSVVGEYFYVMVEKVDGTGSVTQYGEAELSRDDAERLCKWLMEALTR